MITDNGTLVRTESSQIRECGRSAQGVRLINLRNNEKLISLKVIKNDGEVSEDDIPSDDADIQVDTQVAVETEVQTESGED